MPQLILLAPSPLTTAVPLFGARAALRPSIAAPSWCWPPFALVVVVFLLGAVGVADRLFRYAVIDRLTVWRAASATASLAVSLLRFDTVPGAPPAFGPVAEVRRSDPSTVLTPPLALDGRILCHGQVDIVGSGASETPTRPTGSSFLYRADRTTLTPVGPPRLIVDAEPAISARTSLTRLSIGRYPWRPRDPAR
jgi:hypothetical protein